jgi:phosphosulfolactate phosphohydrolase-like enzyme
MQIHHATLETCSTAPGVVVVIDVIRAFTVADLDCCAALDRFDFAMRVQRQGELLVIEPAR